MEPHDSFYIRSDVFYSYIVYNEFWDIRIHQRQKYFDLADTFAQCLRTGEFSDTEREQYQYPVDIEYTVNITEAGEYMITLH